MRKVRHKNVVQFIGACTRRPNLCIVFEFMAGGSVYDYMRKVRSATHWFFQNCLFKVSVALLQALAVSVQTLYGLAVHFLVDE